MRGYFEIGIFHNKTPSNLGTLWRSAYQLGAAGIFTIGKRYSKQGSDTVKAWRHVPMREYTDFDHFLSCQPLDCLLVAIEMGGKPLTDFSHPERAIYLLGAEDHGLPESVLSKCNNIVSIESINTESYNVSIAGSIVMYHRNFIWGQND
jgi:tRNA G18 (ribose-2'-O)-methylase SpoU